MNDTWGDITVNHREVVMSAILEEDWWSLETQRHEQEAERWQRRVELAERHQEFDLATQAAQRSRHHAGLALAAIQARSRAMISEGGRGWTD
jgi:hypothetical protein